MTKTKKTILGKELIERIGFSIEDYDPFCIISKIYDAISVSKGHLKWDVWGYCGCHEWYQDRLPSWTNKDPPIWAVIKRKKDGEVFRIMIRRGKIEKLAEEEWLITHHLDKKIGRGFKNIYAPGTTSKGILKREKIDLDEAKYSVFLYKNGLTEVIKHYFIFSGEGCPRISINNLGSKVIEIPKELNIDRVVQVKGSEYGNVYEEGIKLGEYLNKSGLCEVFLSPSYKGEIILDKKYDKREILFTPRRH